MTDRHKGYIVTLEDDIREDDAETIIAALRMIKGVLSVEALVANYDDHMARERVRREVVGMLYDLAARINKS